MRVQSYYQAFLKASFRTKGPIYLNIRSFLALEPTKSPYYQVVCVRSAAISVYFYRIKMYSSGPRTILYMLVTPLLQSDFFFHIVPLVDNTELLLAFWHKSHRFLRVSCSVFNSVMISFIFNIYVICCYF